MKMSAALARAGVLVAAGVVALSACSSSGGGAAAPPPPPVSDEQMQWVSGSAVAPGGRIFLDGVPRSAVGVVKRDDDGLQVTVGGWPVYRFSKDEKAGDTKGQGVGGTWFGVRPDGKKSEAKGAAGTSRANGGAGDGDSVTVFDGKNFSDNGASQGTSGPGCQNLARRGVGSSLRLSGGPVKIWSQPNCTGESSTVTADVPDLSAINFDNKIASVKFGV